MDPILNSIKLLSSIFLALSAGWMHIGPAKLELNGGKCRKFINVHQAI